MKNETDWRHINFVGNMENLYDDTKRLLEKVGAWEEYGSNGWGKNSDSALFYKPRPTEGVARESNTAAREKVKRFYTPRLLKKVLEYVKVDYENPVLNLTLPDWVNEILDKNDDPAVVA
jgi:hypothetical protein